MKLDRRKLFKTLGVGAVIPAGQVEGPLDILSGVLSEAEEDFKPIVLPLQYELTNLGDRTMYIGCAEGNFQIEPNGTFRLEWSVELK